MIFPLLVGPDDTHRVACAVWLLGAIRVFDFAQRRGNALAAFAKALFDFHSRLTHGRKN